MTAQEVIKKFMAALDNQNYSDGVSILDDAVRNSSRFSGIQDAISQFLEDQKAAERQAIKDILGDNYKPAYANLQLSDLLELAAEDEDLRAILSETDTYSDHPRSYGPEYNGSTKPRSFTAAERIRMKTAEIFLAECGIELPYYCYRAINATNNQLMATYNSVLGSTGNEDTGAITGYDAGGGTVKNASDIVPEIGNKYTAKDSNPQNISTGTNGWIVNATKYGDTIISSGADSINAGNGWDDIYIEGDNATVTTGNYTNDAVTIRDTSNKVTLTDLEQWDDLNIQGDFVVKSAILDEDADTVTVTAVNGRTLIIENWSTAKNSTVRLGEDAIKYVHSATALNPGGQKLGAWLNDFIPYEDTSTEEIIAMPVSESSPVIVNLDDVTGTGGSFSLESGARQATYNAGLSTGNIGTVSSEFTGVSSFTVNGLTVELWGRSSSSETSKVSALTYDELSKDEKAIFAGLYKWWVKEGLKLNEESFGMSFAEDGTTKHNLKVYFYNGGSNDSTLAFVTDYNQELALAVNVSRFQNISETDQNAEVKIGNTSFFLDRTIAHELNHAVLKANIENFNKLPQFVTEGLAELVHGIDDERITRIWDLAARNTTNVSTDTTAVMSGTVRIEDALDLNNTGTGNDDSYAAGYMFLRYFAKKAAIQTEDLPPLGDFIVSVNLDGENATYYANLNSPTAVETAIITSTDSNVSVGGARNHSYTPAAGIKQSVTATDHENWKFNSIGSKVTVSSGRGADTAIIYGTENNVNLGAGNNSISNEGTYNTITAGIGDDSIKMNLSAKHNEVNLGDGNNYVSLTGSENVIITGAGDDVVKFTKISNVEGSTSSNYLNTGDGVDSLNVAGENNTIEAGAGDDSILVYTTESSIFGGDGADYFQVSAANNTVSGGFGNDKFYIFNSKNVVNGDDGIDYFQVSAKNNTINGGAGNDSIYVTVSDNTIIGGAGADTIMVDKSSNLSDFTITDIDYKEDTLFFTGVIESIEKIDDGIKVTYTGSNKLSVKIHFADTYLPDLDNLTISYFEPIVGTDTGNVYTKKLSDYVSMQIFTGWQIDEEGYAIYYVDDVAVAIVGGLNLEGVTVVRGEINGITIKDGCIFIDENLATDYVTFNSYDYILRFSKDNVEYLSGSSSNDTLEEVDRTLESGNAFIAFGGMGNDSISIKDSTIIDERDEGSRIEVYGEAGEDTISISGVEQNGGGLYLVGDDNFSGDNDTLAVSDVNQSGGIIQIFGGNAQNYSEGNDSISVSNVTQSGGYLAVYGEASEDTISVKDVDQSNGYILVFGGDSNSLGTSNSSNDVITTENINQSGGYLGIFGNNVEDSISTKNNTVAGGVFQVSGYEGDDALSAENVSVSEGGNFDIYGDAGDDTISIKNIAIQGDSSVYAVGGDDDDFISVNNVTQSGGIVEIDGEDGNNTISVEKASISNETAKLEINGGADDDSTSVGNSTISSGGSLDINGKGGNDTITAKNISIKSSGIVDITGDTIDNSSNSISVSDVTIENNSGLEISAGTGNDIISISNVKFNNPNAESVLNLCAIDWGGDNSLTFSNVTQKGGTFLTTLAEGKDTLTINNVKVSDGGSFAVTSGENDDIVSVTDSSGVVIFSGEGKDTLAFGGNVTAKVHDFSVNDVISLGSAISEATFDNGVLTLGKVKLELVDTETWKPIESIPKESEYANIKVITGGKTVTLGKLLGFVYWEIEGTTAKYGKLMEITGVSEKATPDDFEWDGKKTVTVSANAITENGLTITEGYNLALGDDVNKLSVETDPSWKVDNGTAKYATTITEGYTAVGNKIIYQMESDGNTLVTVTGLNTKATANDISLDDNVITVAANALNADNVVRMDSDKYTFELADDVVQPKVQNPAWRVANGEADYMVGATNAGYVVENNVIVYQEMYDGESTIKITGLNAKATAKNISLDTETNTITLIPAIVRGKVTVTEGYALNMGKGSYTSTTVAGGAGDDSIYSAGSKLSIDGGAGKDIISLSSGTSGNTISGSLGDDYISADRNSKNIYQYAAGDGNDTIYGFTENDTLNITNGSIDGWKIDSSTADLILTVGTGTITIKDGANKKINIAIGKGKATANFYSADGNYNDKKTAITLDAETKKYTVPSKFAVVTIDGSATDGVEIIANAKPNLITSGKGADVISGGSGNDSIYGGEGSDVINGEDGNDKLFGEAGDDTISGGKGNDTFTGGSGKDVFIYGGGNDVIADYAEEDKISIASGEISSIAISGKDVAIKVGKNTLKIKGGLNEKITINDEAKIYQKGKIYSEDRKSVTVTSAVTLESTLVNIDGSLMSSALKYSANAENNKISGGKGGDSVKGGTGNDILFGNAGNDKLFGETGDDVLDGGAGNDTLWGGAGNNTLTGGAGSDIFIYEGGNDIIIDYEVGKDKISIPSAITGAKVVDTNVILETDSGKVTVKDGTDKKLTLITKVDGKTKTINQIYAYAGIYNDKQTAITLNADAKTYTVPEKPAITSVDGSATNGVQITGGKKADKIIGGNGKDTLNGGKGNDTLIGGDGTDIIIGDEGNDKLFGDAGADTIGGGIGNDTLTGGNGSDVFIYTGGNDVIMDYESGDKISIANGEVSSISSSGKDMVFKIGKNTLKIKNGLGKDIKINEELKIYEKGKIYNADKTAVTLTAAATIESSVINVDASEMSAALKFEGNEKDNLVYGGKGGDSIKGGSGRDTIYGNAGNDKIYGDLGNDYLDGGAGNDSVWGGAGADSIYGDAGNDKIYGESANDYIEGGAGNDIVDGGAGDDTLIGGDGGDSIYGGLGKNSLVGGYGNDVFVHEGGDDFIEDYTSGQDKIKFTAEIARVDTSGPNVIFKTVDDGVLTVRKAVGQEITYIDSKNKTIKHTYNSAHSETYDLICDNNFVTDEFGIDEITEAKYEVQNIETQNNLELSQPVITYSEDK